MRKNKKPWPTAKSMQQVYEKHLWGGNQKGFYSGEGSHDTKVVEPYITSVSAFLSSFDVAPVVCDLGCGDFNIGNRLLPYAKQFKAVDIVPALIARNRQVFLSNWLSFHCADISKDELPNADVAILRQVLQHLSNVEIARTTKKLNQYEYVVLTEHLPLKPFTPNLDIVSGQGTRLKKNSGVDLLAPPFELLIQSKDLLSSVETSKPKGVIETWVNKMKL